jgi:formyltetrahydrofolate hydrolase|tara:strand:+ start:362 stop:667 length:306 start_codon:yes stop_codon:yes gene_type:complete
MNLTANKKQQTKSKMNKRSYVMITEGGSEPGRVAQVIDYLYDKSVYAIRINYNGYVRFEKKQFLRKATQEEKNKDKKEHNKELQLNRHERAHLNTLRYPSL